MPYVIAKSPLTVAIDQMSAILDRPASAFVGCTLRQLFKAAEYQGAWVHWREYRGMDIDRIITTEDIPCSR